MDGDLEKEFKVNNLMNISIPLPSNSKIILSSVKSCHISDK